mmetsp:Transcript_6126/g.7533  ORF Transcript_6126/g.7533 Transcript_6126/m.7533 type:complete len:83 (-) Transcript_6126:1251-1499(-)
MILAPSFLDKCFVDDEKASICGTTTEHIWSREYSTSVTWLSKQASLYRIEKCRSTSNHYFVKMRNNTMSQNSKQTEKRRLSL